MSLLLRLLESIKTILKAVNRKRLLRRRDEQACLRNLNYRRSFNASEDAGAVTRQLFQAWAEGHAPSAHHESASTAGAPSDSKVMLICFYLPQFHAIPENDTWWGTGFTEWRNLARSMPRFSGHRQPSTPADLGFYDLSHPDTLKRQIALARQAGVTGFSFYYYNFDGRRILEKPLEMFLGDRTLDLDFCITWANENWTRRWDGLNDDILLKQSHAPEGETALADDICRHFSDLRYIRISGRPLFILYRPNLIPDCVNWVKRFRRNCQERHGENPYIMMVQGFGNDDPREFELDAAVEFPPHKLIHGLKPETDLALFDPAFSGTYYRYDDLIDASLAQTGAAFDLAKCVAPSWDNEARRPGRGTGFIGSTPQKYERWLRSVVDHAREHPLAQSQGVVFINAWNEWAEGAYLEPDTHFGHAYLNATRRALQAAAADETRP